MKEANDHIKKLFSEFEPEVSDAKIGEGWEKMRYFLPQEEKRRGLAWFWYAGIGSVLLLTSWLLLRTPIAGQAAAKPEKKADQVQLDPDHTSSGHEQAVPGAASTQPLSYKGPATPAAKQDQPTERADHGPGHSTPDLASANDLRSSASSLNNNRSVSNTGASQTANNISTAQTPEPPIAQKKNDPEASLSENQERSVVNMSTPQVITNDQQALSSLHGETSESSTAASVSPEDNELVLLSPVMYNTIPVLDSLPDPALAELRRLPWSPFQRRFGIQIVGGPAYTASSLNALAFADKKQYNAFGVSCGVALAYYFNSRLSALAQFNFTKSALSYGHEIIQTRILQQVPYNSVGTAYVDTTVVYRKAYTESHFSLSSAYNISLGAAYVLLKKGRVDLSATLYMSLRRASYEFTENYTLSAETYSGSLRGLPPLVPAGFPPAAQKLSGVITTTGLTPGLMLGYSVYRNVALIFRPSYLLQISSGNNAVKDKFNLRQNTLYLDLGIRIRW